MKYRKHSAVTINNFWDSIDIRGPNDCWPAMKHLDKNGILKVSHLNKPWTSSRLVYFLSGKVWDDNLDVKHWCKNKSCNNIKHLFLGTEENIRKQDINKFYSQLKQDFETGCLNFTGYVNYNGYGQIRFGKSLILTHRLAWELVNGVIPDGLHIRHFICDNPPCCNVGHLRLGTAKDNSLDRDSKNRGGTNKLTREMVSEIREKTNIGISQLELSEEYGVTVSNVSKILKNHTWKTDV